MPVDAWTSCDLLICYAAPALDSGSTELNLVSPVASVSWLASSPMLQLGPAVDEAAASDAWQLINAVLDNTSARYDGTIEDRARTGSGS